MIKPGIFVNQVKTVYLGIGSNLGDKIYNIEAAKYKLLENNINILKKSSFYKSYSWPDHSKPMFLNIVVKIETELSPIQLLKVCNKIETDLGRKRLKKNDPRTCDIDIIDYDQKVININGKKNLNLPHPLLTKRNFVLLPLFELSRSWKHPKNKVNITKLINLLDINDLRTIKQI